MIYEIFIIGGGVNGVAIARDAAGRGLSVALAEKGDLAQETSSKSTKLLHGGLRYLEYFEFKLVRESLMEREVLLRNMPHIASPMRFVLPYHPDQRFAGGTPSSRLLEIFMPWLKGRRPAWLLRLGLWLYDHLGKRRILPATRRIDLRRDPVGAPLQLQYIHAFEYSDVWVEDARLVSLMARDAFERGANIMTRNQVLSLERQPNHWKVYTEAGVFLARTLINAAGPWVEKITRDSLGIAPKAHVRLVKGSHILVPQLFDHDKAYFFQGRDGRIIFAIPYQQHFTLLGTTDEPHDDADQPPECSKEEIDYLCQFANEYFETSISANDVVWTFSGVRPLYDDGAKSATAATRDYVLSLHQDNQAVLLNVFGGKITTHRRLAEEALELLGHQASWTQQAPLAGGDFDVESRDALCAKLARAYPELDAKRLFDSYGSEAFSLFDGDWGMSFGAGLFACEVDHLMEKEFAQTPEDILWRRTKLGLRSGVDILALEQYMQARR